MPTFRVAVEVVYVFEAKDAEEAARKGRKSIEIEELTPGRVTVEEMK